MSTLARVVRLRDTRDYSRDPAGFDASLAEQASLATPGMSKYWVIGALLELGAIDDDDDADSAVDGCSAEDYIDFMCGMDEMGEAPLPHY